MDSSGLNILVEYGILGLWTLSLLLSNHTMRKNFQSRYDDLNKNVVDTLKKKLRNATAKSRRSQRNYGKAR